MVVNLSEESPTDSTSVSMDRSAATLSSQINRYSEGQAERSSCAALHRLKWVGCAALHRLD